VLRIVKYPHPALRHKSKPLRRVDGELKNTVREMFDLMYLQKGIGLAANQVDLPYRFFVLNPEGDPEQGQEYVFLNPVINKRSGTEEAEEGCLSFPEIYAPVKRSAKIVISAYNLAGEEVNYELTGLLARAAQHEYDHSTASCSSTGSRPPACCRSNRRCSISSGSSRATGSGDHPRRSADRLAIGRIGTATDVEELPVHSSPCVW